jgi:hypothetical protein
MADNSGRNSEARRRGPGRPWAKGESGNPGGRPKMERTILELAREHTEDAMRTLIDIAKDRKAPPSARVGAAQAILDRGWGRATQVIDATVRSELTVEEIDARLAALVAGLAAADEEHSCSTEQPGDDAIKH